MKRLTAICLLSLCLSVDASLVMKATKNPQLDYPAILQSEYDENITHPDKILGFEIGFRVASPEQITQSIQTWKSQSKRMLVQEYARSHENRPLHAVFISSPENLSKLDDIQKKLNQLADPRGINDSEADKLIDELPAVAWMAYSIHGNETSGADAALAAIYHYIADTSEETKTLLENMIIIIDPLMNPDGRARFSKSLEQYRGAAPNVDNQSLLHSGDWPYGRTNHYFFDLNRDFFYLTQPETQGRVALINKWRPQLMIDGHEMGSQDTYLMGPPREPLNFNIAPSVQKWAKVFSVEQGAAFDERGWRYYTGEWFENWYPGYSNYAEYRGSMHILYEQSRMAEDGVRRPEGSIQTYKESVDHQLISTYANLQSLQKHSKAMYKDYFKDRKRVLSSDSPYKNKAYIVSASDNLSRLERLAEKLLAQDIEVFQLTQETTYNKAINQFGNTVGKLNAAKGSLIINARQPEARLLAAIMEFDAGIKDETLQKERQQVLEDGSSIMYDTSAWNLTMMYGLEAYTVDDEIDRNIEPFTPSSATVSTAQANAIMWVVDGADDKSVAFAARLLEQDIQVRVIDKEAVLDGKRFNRGSVAVTVTDNPNIAERLSLVENEANYLGLRLHSLTSGYGKGEYPDWGGDHFVLLQKPQIAVATQEGTSSYDSGTTWWTIDSNLGIRHSHLDSNSLSRNDLRRYNVIVLPHRYSLSDNTANALKQWVRNGGTLIAHANSSALLTQKEGLTQVKLVQDISEDAEDFNLALQRRLLARESYAITDALKQSSLHTNVSYPWDDAPKALDAKVLKKKDQWQSMFMPAGAMVAGTVNTEHWLSFGVNPSLPLLYMDQPVLIAPQGVESVIDLGVYKDNKEAEYETRFAWYSIPNGKTIDLRMSGLVWPEAQQRIANSSYLTRERLGLGQVILFSGQPFYRGAAFGTNRLLLNALVYGPGFGSRANIDL